MSCQAAQAETIDRTRRDEDVFEWPAARSVGKEEWGHQAFDNRVPCFKNESILSSQ